MGHGERALDAEPQCLLSPQPLLHQAPISNPKQKAREDIFHWPGIPTQNLRSSVLSNGTSNCHGIPPAVPKHGHIPATTNRRRLEKFGSREQCNHGNLTRVWDRFYTCNRCGRPPSWGWTFKCAEDVEPALRAAVESKEPGLPFEDEIHKEFAKSNTPPRRGPEVRASLQSILNDYPLEQRKKNYTPEQFDRILEQRINAQATARAQSMKVYRRNPEWNPEKPWILPFNRQCAHKLCAQCTNHLEGRTFESIDAVVNGEVSMSSVTGYGFWELGSRPVVDAKVVVELGTRFVPPKPRHPSLTPTQRGPEHDMAGSESGDSFEGLDLKDALAPNGEGDDPQSSSSSVIDYARGANLVRDRFPSIEKVCDDEYPVRSAWTPHATPRSYFANTTPNIAGSSDASLKTNPEAKYRNISTMRIPTNGAVELDSACSFLEPNREKRLDVGLTLLFNDFEYTKAVRTPLPSGGNNEEPALGEAKVMRAEKLSGVFKKGLPEIQGGLALTENGVEEAVPDITTSPRAQVPLYDGSLERELEFERSLPNITD